MKTDLLKSRMVDPDIGIYRNMVSPQFPVYRSLLRMEVGYTDVARQVEYIQENPTAKFELSVSNSPHYSAQSFPLAPFRDLRNVRGLGGSGLTLSDFDLFENLTRIFVGGDSAVPNFAQHKFLNSVTMSLTDQLKNLNGLEAVQDFEIFFERSSILQAADISALRDLRYLYVSDVKAHTLSFLSELKKLRILTFDGAKYLSDVSVLPELKDVDVLRFGRIRKVSDWSPIVEMTWVQELSLTDAGTIRLPVSAKANEHIANANFHGTRVQFV